MGPLTGHGAGVSVVTFSHDGQKFASGSHDNSVRIWDARKGVQLTVLKPGFSFSISDIAFSVDDQYVVGCTDTQTNVPITVWNVNTGTAAGEPLALFGHSDGVSSVAFTPDGKNLVTSSWDGTIRVWDFGLILQDDRVYDELCDKSVKVQDSIPDDGWIRSKEGDLLLWIPQEYRHGLKDRSLYTIPWVAKSPVKLDCTKFCHGKDWTKIREF